MSKQTHVTQGSRNKDRVNAHRRDVPVFVLMSHSHRANGVESREKPMKEE